MARKMPPRYKTGPKKGQFKPKAARKRRSRKNPPKRKAATRRRTTRRATTKRKSPARRRTYRSNPKRGDMVDTFTTGLMDAGGVLVGKAAVRSIPQLLTLPQAGNTGLAVQAATAVAVGMVADRFVGPDVARMLLAGGLTAPMESLVVRYNIPWLSTALASSSTTGLYANRATVRGYVPGYSNAGQLNGYVQPSAPAPVPAQAAGVAGYRYGR